MSFHHHQATDAPRPKKASRGNIFKADSGVKNPSRRCDLDVASINRACNAFLLERVPGYRLMGPKLDFRA